MLQKKHILRISGLLIILVLSCSLGTLVLDGYYLPFKACRPIAYPSGTQLQIREGTTLTHITSDEIDVVTRFFDQQLLASQKKPLGMDLGQWHREKLNRPDYSYVCYGNDINGLTTETGCITLRQTESGTEIESTLFRSEGSHTPCQ